MVEAIVIAIPIVLIQLLNVLAQALVLIMILLFYCPFWFPLFKCRYSLWSFKVMFGGLAFPAIQAQSLLTLALLYLEKSLKT